jgi:hypothetical protein
MDGTGRRVALLVALVLAPLVAPPVREVGRGVAWGYAYFAVGADAGAGPHVRVFDVDNNPPGVFDPVADGFLSFLPYARTFAGGVRVAIRSPGLGTQTSGGRDALLVTGAGPGGGPHVIVYDVYPPASPSRNLLASGFAYDPLFAGGVSVAVGSFDANPLTRFVVTGAGAGGGPHVRVFQVTRVLGGPALVEVDEFASFFAYDAAFAGGVWVGAGDVDGDGVDEVVTGAGPGGGPDVRVFRLAPDGTPTLAAAFLAYAPAFAGGVFVAAADLDGDGRAEIVTGAGPGGGPHVKVFDVAGAGASLTVSEKTGFFAYAAAFAGGVRVGAGDWNLDPGYRKIYTGAGPGGGPHVRTFQLGAGGAAVPSEVSFFAFPPTFLGGVFVGGDPD